MLIDNIPLSIDNQRIGNHLAAQSTQEVAVGIEHYLIFPSVVVYQGLHLVGVLCLVDANGNDFHARLFLPLLVHLADSIQLAVARFAPGGKEVDDERFAAI